MEAMATTVVILSLAILVYLCYFSILTPLFSITNLKKARLNRSETFSLYFCGYIFLALYFAVFVVFVKFYYIDEVSNCRQPEETEDTTQALSVAPSYVDFLLPVLFFVYAVSWVCIIFVIFGTMCYFCVGSRGSSSSAGGATATEDESAVDDLEDLEGV